MKLAHSGSHASAHTASAERAVGSFQLFYKVGGGSNGHMLATISHGINRPSRVDSGDTWMSHSLPLRLDLKPRREGFPRSVGSKPLLGPSIPVALGPPTLGVVVFWQASLYAYSVTFKASAGEMHARVCVGKNLFAHNRKK